MKTSTRRLGIFAAGVLALVCIGLALHVSLPDLSGFTPDQVAYWAVAPAAFTASVKQLQTLVSRRAGILAEMQALTTTAGARDDGSFTDDERTTFDAHAAAIKTLDGDIARIQGQVEATRTGTAAAGHIQTEENVEKDPKRGFATFGEFAQAVHAAAVNGMHTADPRLSIGAAAASTYNNESSGSDGGILVPPAFSSTVLATSYNAVDSLLPLTDNTPVNGNSMAFPVDESTPWGSSGVKAYWTNEAAAMQQSKASFDPAVLRLSKLTCLVPVTDELLHDSAAIGAYLTSKTPEAITFKTNEALWNGDGIGKPKGFYRSGALVTQAKESAQSAGTVLALNVSKMRARMSAASYRRAVWMINNDVLPQLDQLAYGTASTNTAIYNPVGGTYGYGTLLGRPVMVTQHNESIGAAGDIALVDWKMYVTITSTAGVETASSMHFWFDQGITAFRAVFRVAGQSALTKPVTPNKGSSTLSPIVVLEAR